MEELQSNREKAVLERILTLKQMRKDGRAGPLELHELAVCYYHINNLRQSVKFTDELLEKFPDYIELSSVHSLRIYCQVLLEDYAGAEANLVERLKFEEQDTRLLGMLAFVQEKTGFEKKAVETHRKILRLDPSNINSLNSLGYLLTLYGTSREWPEAFDCLKKAIEQKPDHPAYLDSFGVHLSKRGQNDNAKKALIKALKKSPHNAEILQHLKEAAGIGEKKQKK